VNSDHPVLDYAPPEPPPPRFPRAGWHDPETAGKVLLAVLLVFAGLWILPILVLAVLMLMAR
jgi:hypothetical protein